ncbi:hypothetical protein C6Q19_01595 [Burkholderia cenocepacia]|nr:hypothetical protein C6Q10_32395 [Burkholderia multivorans]PRF96103.1 hypothetical protein C6Q19_01595 [Burkholderia cenocepacia]
MSRLRQGLKPEGGETRAARLDAQRESPARSEAKGGAQGRPQIPHERVERRSTAAEGMWIREAGRAHQRQAPLSRSQGRVTGIAHPSPG